MANEKYYQHVMVHLSISPFIPALISPLLFQNWRNSTRPLRRRIPSMPVVLLSDNEAALDLADGTTTNHRKPKHIDIRYHQVCHFVEEGKVEVSHIASEYQIADIFTKALGPQRHQFLVQLMGMTNSYDLQ
jgi:hypothetical protein